MNVKAIIEKVGSQPIAEATGKPRSTVHTWSWRGIIPAIYWPAISRMPQAKRAGVTLEVLEKSGKKESGK